MKRAPAIVFAGSRWDRDDVDPDDLLITRPPPLGQAQALKDEAAAVAVRFGTTRRAALVYLAAHASTSYRTQDGIERATGLSAFAVEIGLTEAMQAGILEAAERVGKRITRWRRCR